jgi:hypothetical protein
MLALQQGNRCAVPPQLLRHRVLLLRNPRHDVLEVESTVIAIFLEKIN